MKTKALVTAVIILVLCGIAWAVSFWWNLGNSVGYSPEQPIPFSHKIHAGDNQIPCLYCHTNADKGRVATVPSLNVCMNCHSVVRPESPYIQKMKEHYEKNEPIEWIKVHDQPDFVYFNHRAHIAKGTACETCHGDVKNMTQIEQVETLNMGFCIDCHRKKEAAIDCYVCHR